MTRDKWEYKQEHSSNTKTVAELGLAGWEAYASLGSYMLFKRKLIEEEPIEIEVKPGKSKPTKRSSKKRNSI